MKQNFENEHASCQVVQNPELPADMERVREVVRVWTDPAFRNEGYATELMKAVCDEADSEGVVLILQPKPFDANIAKARLLGFYARFGFVKTQDQPVLMARAPSFRPRLTSVVQAVDGVVRG
ncbi:GNAT family N-acetyltransferase [Hydrogenophaga laconesensis]|uniref:GNAT superfamily N-acetyltransferase n=1 Tax=Hydrogenophaga laconesensis TaxID=1805971 RepID=A0ABU1V9K0_9BURK|nr:GNAT family N-acetyltransferase [Hydrogenophaga laconesensis]MDR7094144.1 GNAT superfamily N-acetyltransferase [Hydrogenophaga laconesensis]